MKSVQICSNLLEPLISKDGKKVLKDIEKEAPFHYEKLMSMKNDLNIIYNDLLKFQGFITILKADKTIYQERIKHKRRMNQDTSLEETILNRINCQLDLLREEEYNDNTNNC